MAEEKKEKETVLEQLKGKSEEKVAATNKRGETKLERLQKACASVRVRQNASNVHDRLSTQCLFYYVTGKYFSRHSTHRTHTIKSKRRRRQN